mmetsp:Transcript_21282/g.41301  ORF Transcript_21282/g.41301 Transcript_21282/m.41301 type:complete len:223 (+) Transcript_21282:74-742(+)
MSHSPGACARHRVGTLVLGFMLAFYVSWVGRNYSFTGAERRPPPLLARGRQQGKSYKTSKKLQRRVLMLDKMDSQKPEAPAAAAAASAASAASASSASSASSSSSRFRREQSRSGPSTKRRWTVEARKEELGVHVKPPRPLASKAQKRKRRDARKKTHSLTQQRDRDAETSRLWTKTFARIEKMAPVLGKESGMLPSSDVEEDEDDDHDDDEGVVPAKRARR